jgi:hypothetical protein
MNLRNMTMAWVIALLIGTMVTAGSAGAATIGDCSLTGYTFMGGGIAYTNPIKDYFLAQPLVEESANYWGYGWLKFDNLSTETVDSAYLAVDALGQGSMSIVDLSETNVGDLSIYSPGTTDVDDLAGDATLRASLQSTLSSDDGSLLLGSNASMTSNGLYYFDITDLYNGWVNGEDNNGLVLASDVGIKLAGIGNADGSAPYISSVSAVPVPAAVWLLGSGLLGSLGLRRKRS